MGFDVSLFTATLALDSLLIMALILMSCRMLSKASASLRHQLLAGAFLAILVLPVLVMSVPAWDISGIPDPLHLAGIFQDTGPGEAVPAVTSASSVYTDRSLPGGSIDSEGSLLVTTNDPVVPGKDLSQVTGSQAGPEPFLSRIAGILLGRIHILLLVVWAGGAATILIVQLVRWAGAGFVAEMSNEQQNEVTLSIAEKVREETGLERPVVLLRSELTAVTMAWGIFKSYIILPSDSDSWPVDKMEEVLRHEMAHLKRRDNMVLILAVFACAVYWFNPLVWKALKRLHYEREVSCDDFVLNSGGTPSSYARHLMEISIKLSGARSGKIIPAAMAHSSDVKKRLISVLDPSKNRRPAGLAASIVCVLLVIGLAMPVAAFRPWEVRAAEAAGTSDIESLSVESIESILQADDEEDDDDYTKEEIKRLRKRLKELKEERDRLRRERRELLRQSDSERQAEQSMRSREALKVYREVGKSARAESSERARAVSRASSRASARSRTSERYNSGSQWKINGTICSGEDRYSLDRTTLENCERGYKVESRKAVLDPDAEGGVRFESGSGFLKITLENDDDLVEYWIEPASGRWDGDIEKTVHVNGSDVPFDGTHEREVEKILDEITDLLGDIGGIGSGSSEVYLSALEAPELVEAIELEGLTDLSRLVPIIEDIDLDEVDLDDAVVIVNGEIMGLHDDLDEQSDVFEKFAEVFEEIKDYHIESFEDKEAGRIVEDIYLSREPRIERLVEDGIRLVEEKRDYDKAIEIVADILDEYSEVAIRSIDSVEERRSRKELKKALLELYSDLGESATDVLEDIEGEDDDVSVTARRLYELLLKNSRATRREIERK